VKSWALIKKKFQCQTLQWFRNHRHPAQHPFTMKQLYVLASISRQAHHQGVQRLKTQAQKEEVYVRLMEQVRAIHPGMGLRTMYDMVQPDGIGRDGLLPWGSERVSASSLRNA
jgi:hypothetical protein